MERPTFRSAQAVTLEAGTRLGTYEIVGPLGRGGMGEVYRARDTKLKREVAIKILPDGFAGDRERVARFQREAELLASLNHPHIAAIHDLADAGTSRFLVLELVEGETLADRIARGPIPLDEALAIILQVADALEAAHEKGITHRDLKPANIKIAPEGTVKVLDFGLAKALDPTGGANSDIASLNTMTSPAMTQIGMILGTAAYMSPEQARGRVVDKRCDIWAFGVVLYEMVTGRRLFDGADVSETLAAVLKDTPDWSGVPDKVRTLLQRCLEKDPRKRLRDVGDARLLLDDRAEMAPAAARRWPWIATTAILALSLGVAAWMLWRASQPAARIRQPLVQLDVDLGEDTSLVPTTNLGTNTIISRDGSRLAYVTRAGIFTRKLDQPNPMKLAGTENAAVPFFSPDGEWIGFLSAGLQTLKKVSVDGGAVVPLGTTGMLHGVSWGDGDILVASSRGRALVRLSANGGDPTTLLEAGREEFFRWPFVLPGGQAVLFTSNSGSLGFDTGNIEVFTLGDRRRKTLLRGVGTNAKYLGIPGGLGYLLYVSRRTLFAVAFDLQHLDVRGTPVPMLTGVVSNTNYGFAEFDTSAGGTVVYNGGGTTTDLTVQWMDATGKTTPVGSSPGLYQRPRLSPDGQRVAVTAIRGGLADIVVHDVQRQNETRLTFGDRNSDGALWTPDGRYILFQAPGGMFWTRAGGGGTIQAIANTTTTQFPYSFAPALSRLAYFELGPDGGYDLWTVPFTSDSAGFHAGKPEVYLRTPKDERHPAFSPDGKWIAYTSNESGEAFQVFVRAFPDTGGRWQVSKNGGVYPMFADNGRDLFFRTEDSQVMVASYIVKDGEFVADPPRVWTEKRLADLGVVLNYDVASGGKRIIAVMPSESAERQKRNHVTFLVNFLDELQRRVLK